MNPAWLGGAAIGAIEHEEPRIASSLRRILGY